MKKQYKILCMLLIVVLTGCHSKQIESATDPETSCASAEIFAQYAMEMRQENDPKFLVKIIVFGVYLFDDLYISESHHQFQDVIDLAYEQDKAISEKQKQKQLESFPQLAYEQCLENFNLSNTYTTKHSD